LTDGIGAVVVGGAAVGDGVCGLAIGFGALPGDGTGDCCAEVETDIKTIRAMTDNTCFIFDFYPLWLVIT